MAKINDLNFFDLESALSSVHNESNWHERDSTYEKVKIYNNSIVSYAEEPQDQSEISVAHATDYLIHKLTHKEIYDTFKRCFVRLKGFLLFSKIFREIQDFGTSAFAIRNPGRKTTDKYSFKIRNKFKSRTISKVKFKPNLGLLIHPDSRYKQIWNISMLLLLLYVFLVMPYNIAFEELQVGDTLWIIETLVDVLFTLDIFITLNSAYFDSHRFLVISRWEIFVNYLKGLLFLDIISVFPFSQLSEGSANRSNSLIRIIRIIKISRIFRASKLSKLFENVKSSETLSDILRFFKRRKALLRLILAVFTILILAHFFACMWYYIAKLDNFDYTTWVFRYGYLNKSKGELYLISLYFAFTILTTVGFGDITAITNSEMILCICWMLFGIGFYSFLVGTLSSILATYDNENAILLEKLEKIEEFSIKAGLSIDLIKKLKQETRKIEHREKIDEESNLAVIAKLPMKYRYKIALEMNYCAVRKIPFFTEQSSTFLCDIVPKLKKIEIPADQYIYRKHDHPEEVYFMIDGRASYVYGKENITFKYIVTGSYFGEIEFIKNCKRLHSVIAETHTVLLTMGRSLFVRMIESYPNTAQYMREIAEIRVKKCNEGVSNLQKMFEILDCDKTKDSSKTFSVDLEKDAEETLKSPSSNKKLFTRTKTKLLNTLEDKKIEVDISHTRIEKIERDIESMKLLLSRFNSNLEKLVSISEKKQD